MNLLYDHSTGLAIYGQVAAYSFWILSSNARNFFLVTHKKDSRFNIDKFYLIFLTLCMPHPAYVNKNKNVQHMQLCEIMNHTTILFPNLVTRDKEGIEETIWSQRVNCHINVIQV